MCSIGFIEGLYSKYPRIDREIIEKYSEGVIATSCCIGAELPQLLILGKEEEAEKRLKWIIIAHKTCKRLLARLWIIVPRSLERRKFVDY